MPAEHEPPALAPSTAQREQIVQLLCAHFANDHFTVEELESRLDRAYQARSLIELNELVAGLPAIAAPAAEATSARAAALADVPATGRIAAVLGSTERRGAIMVPAYLHVSAILGSVELDLREAVFGARVIEIHASAVFGSISVYVPPGVRMECDGTPVLGSFEADVPNAETDGGPVIRLTGRAIFGSVDAQRKVPGR